MKHGDVQILYTNWKGETSSRLIEPRRLYHGSTQFHPEPQLLLEALDHGKKEMRTFAVRDIRLWNGSINILLQGLQLTPAAEVVAVTMTGPISGKHINPLADLPVGTKLYTVAGQS